MFPVDNYFICGSILVIVFAVAELIYREKLNKSEEIGTEKKGNQSEEKVSKSLRNRVILMCTFLIITDWRNDWKLDMNYFRWICFTATIIGTVIRCWAKYTLGKYFTYSVGIRSEHKLITNGPYKYLIHPAYFGSVVNSVGLCAFLTPDFRSTYGTVWIGFALGLRFLYYRIKVEETILEKEFGKQFTDRLKTTYRLVPFIY